MLRPPKPLLPSEWAEENLHLPRSMSAEAGRFRMSRTPYLRGIVDAAVESVVEEIVFVKPTQVGGTTAQEILLGHAIDNDPGPALIVKSSEQASEQCVKERLRPLMETSPALARHLSGRPHDNTLTGIKLDSMPVHLAWAGSPQSLATRPIRWLFPDEVDKYPPFAGREADPISLAKERTATYLHRKRVFITSTPTTRDGAIWRAFMACGDRRYYEVPCPHCGIYQRLVWPQVKWPRLPETDKVKRADAIEHAGLAWYECGNPDCRGRVEDSHKPKMLERGLWVSYDAEDKPLQTVNASGDLTGERPVSKRVGFHLSSLYSPWRRFSDMAAEFIRADGDVALTMNFRNSRLAEPFEIQTDKTEPSTIRNKAKDGPAPKTVPTWARAIIATADTQLDHFYYVVRAWGYEYRSQLLDYGICSTFDELRAYTVNAAYRTADGQAVNPAVLLIDSGGANEQARNRTNEVYQFALSDPGRIKPTKGASGRLTWPVDKKLQRAHGMVLWMIDTEQTKDLLSRLVHDPDESKWMPHSGVNDDYCAQLSSEHKIVDPLTKQERWTKKTAGAANHFLDCEQQQCAAAWDLGCGMPEPVQAAAEQTATDSRIAASDFMNRGRNRW